MGGQACVLYGAAEFSRDLDLVVDSSPDNLARLARALQDLQAENIAVPPFEATWLERGHAIHFRSHDTQAPGLRIDIMSRMRGVSSFDTLWERRTSLQSDEETLELLALPDLVAAKKTQRDKDWPMVRRLLEADYFAHRESPGPERVEFWLRELRTPRLLLDLGARFPERVKTTRAARPLLRLLESGASEADLELALREEEDLERQQDREFWNPLRKELERLRHRRQK